MKTENINSTVHLFGTTITHSAMPMVSKKKSRAMELTTTPNIPAGGANTRAKARAKRQAQTS